MNSRTLLSAFAIVWGAAAFLVAAPASGQAEIEGRASVKEAKKLYKQHCANGLTVKLPNVTDDADLTFALRAKKKTTSVIAICSKRNGVGLTVPVNSINHALALLSWREFEPFWPHAERVWGNDLANLREYFIRQPGLSEGYPFRKMLAWKTSRAIQKSQWLSANGKFTEAYRLLETNSDWLFAEKRMKRRSLDFDREMLFLTLAAIDSDLLGSSASADRLERALSSGWNGNYTPTNLRINRAAYLAEAGRFVEAMQMLKLASAQFRKPFEGTRYYKVGGSEREFAWIYACVHHGLGDTDKASRYVGIVEDAVEQPSDTFLDSTKPSLHIKLRMYRCMDNPTKFFSLYQRKKVGAMSSLWLELQVHRPRDEGPAGLREHWVVPDNLKKHFDQQYRQLPETYAPALQSWKNEREVMASQ